MDESPIHALGDWLPDLSGRPARNEGRAGGFSAPCVRWSDGFSRDDRGFEGRMGPCLRRGDACRFECRIEFPYTNERPVGLQACPVSSRRSRCCDAFQAMLSRPCAAMRRRAPLTTRSARFLLIICRVAGADRGRACLPARRTTEIQGAPTPNRREMPRFSGSLCGRAMLRQWLAYVSKPAIFSGLGLRVLLEIKDPFEFPRT